MFQEIGIGQLPDVQLSDNGIVSRAFMLRNLNTLQAAFRFVKQLPYRRNGDKAAICVVLDEGCGTCSTRHALLYRLVQEQGLPGFELFTGIFRMNGAYAHRLAPLLEQHNLPYVPEAHCYLKYNGAALDCTSAHSSAADFLPQLIKEVAITPEQTTGFKVALHRQYIQECVAADPAFRHMTAEALWTVREACIALLS
jgi:hypothetical protein